LLDLSFAVLRAVWARRGEEAVTLAVTDPQAFVSVGLIP
jgi:hypothetical protein